MAGQLDANRIQYAVETTKSSPESILTSSSPMKWQPVGKSVINLREQTRPIWFRYTVKNVSQRNGTWFVSVPWLVLNKISFVQCDAGGNCGKVYRSGFEVPFSQQFHQARKYVFPVELRSGQQATILMRVEARALTFVPLMVWSKARLAQHNNNANLYYGLAFGMLLALLLYNLSLYIFVRDKSYLLYCLYSASIIFYELAMTGFGTRFLWRDHLWWQGNAFSVTAEVSFIFACLFLREFLELKKFGGWWLRSNTWILVYWCIALVANFFSLYGFLVATVNLMGLVSTLVASAAIVGLWWYRGSLSARYFTIAWSFLMVSTAVTILVMEGVIPFSPMTENIQLVGFVVEMLALSYALAERINRERRQREDAQRMSLQMMRQVDVERSAKLKAQAEALALQQRHTEELELRVLDRTAELQQAMTDLERANRELSQLSVTDPLTRLHNRRYFDQMLANEIERSIRTRVPVSLILVDIDHFKAVNDTYGHLIGDECLKLVAASLRQVVSRSSDLVARYGGEEFAVILPSTPPEDACMLAERIRSAIEKLQFIHLGKRVYLSVSMGVAGGVLARDDAAADLLVAAADAALYRAKDGGRNRVVTA